MLSDASRQLMFLRSRKLLIHHRCKMSELPALPALPLLIGFGGQARSPAEAKKFIFSVVNRCHMSFARQHANHKSLEDQRTFQEDLKTCLTGGCNCLLWLPAALASVSDDFAVASLPGTDGFHDSCEAAGHVFGEGACAPLSVCLWLCVSSCVCGLWGRGLRKYSRQRNSCRRFKINPIRLVLSYSGRVLRDVGRVSCLARASRKRKQARAQRVSTDPHAKGRATAGGMSRPETTLQPCLLRTCSDMLSH